MSPQGTPTLRGVGPDSPSLVFTIATDPLFFIIITTTVNVQEEHNKDSEFVS